ncbi:lysylphosphatidylglycerol synthase transmembrane domain-containing protein [Ilumatobacter nonamiensis]|uniref:lysylphosphatidylglycerol synthase transmembrane domain-containing protein n=1 Tax=Ilumatobacter nonamiensis TaxID=467093 RepID=UPI0003492FC5|nr:lysylphosphatidylglycerol synthase transmembrane domain-containing protein [Ilumatobacter nonamiensis]
MSPLEDPSPETQQTTIEELIPDAPSRRRQVILTTLTVAAIAIVLFGILPQFGDFEKATDAALDLPPHWLLALLVAAVLSIIVYATQWIAVLPELRYRAAFSVANTSFMISNGIPGGGAIVLPTQYAMLADEDVDRTRATAATGVNALWNILATLLMPLVGVCFLVGTGNSTPTWWLTIALGFAGFALVGLLLRGLVRSVEVARRFGVMAERVANVFLRMFKRNRARGWGEVLVRFRESTHGLLSTRWLQISAAHVAIQLTQFAVLDIALEGLQRDNARSTTFATALFAFGMARLGTFIPISPGGLGTVDGALTALLVSAGNATAADALAAVLIWRTLTFLPGMVLGAGSFLLWRRRSASVT